MHQKGRVADGISSREVSKDYAVQTAQKRRLKDP
jgi:hypothetical protein